MSSSPHPAPELEFAHVLYMDFVGYSRLSLQEQLKRHQELLDLLRATNEFQRWERKQELLSIPTGDGVALVFFRDPLAPVRCALELATAVQTHPQMKLRMGVHSGLVYRVRDINTNQNVSGEGIILAQRVMDCGDAGHILLSADAAETLGKLSEWAGCVSDLGECEIKHSEKVRLFNLVKDGLGNPVVPKKVSDTSILHVVLLYKRNVVPDAQVLKLLETELAAQGFKVFVDRHLTVGVQWAQEIAKQVRSADAVIPLLSTASVQSEMLTWEVKEAHEAAQAQNGKPRLLPVRINYTDPLPDELAGFLNPVQQALWEGSDDNPRLVSELVYALQNPTATQTALPPDKLEPAGGAVPLDSMFWIVRPTESDFRAAIARRDSIVLVKGARQMGKTSLLARGLQQARETGAKCIRTDFQKLNTPHLESVDSLFLALAEMIADQLDLDVLPDEVWNAKRGANVNFERYLRREVLNKIDAPIIWAMDEVDRLFTCSFGSEVFGLFRSWHNERSLDPSGPWGRLTLAIAYATEAHLFITDMNQSPFNVGTRLTLEDFTREQVSDLNQRYGGPLRNAAEHEAYYALLGGQPYLVRKGFNEMASHNMSLADFQALADKDEGMFGDHLRRFLVLLVKDTELCEVVRAVLRGQPCTSAESFYRLRSAGVMTGDSARDSRIRCQLYSNYLSRHLL